MSAARAPTDSPPRAGRVEVRLLGGFAAFRPDGSAARAWERPSAKKLLCLLVLTPDRRLEKSDALRLLFPSLAPERAANALAKSSCWLREALGLNRGEGLVSAGSALSWDAPIGSDVEGLLSARAGVLPGGAAELRALADDDRELLPEWSDDWVVGFRDELCAARFAASRALACHLERTGTTADLAEVVRRRQDLVDRDPLDESLHADLLRTLLATGRLPEARAAYTACRQVLWRELGVEPGPELDRLWRQAGAQTAGTPAATPATVVAAPLGRTQIVTGLVDELQGAENGSGSSALVVGDPGIGKTAVVRAVADHFRGRGWRVATAVGGSAPAGSYTTLADALGRLAEGTPHEPFVRGLVSAGPGSLQPVRPETAERALHQRILDILQEAADLPTLLVVDDLHAADPATVRLVHDLAGAPATRSWSLLAAARPFPAVVWVGPEQLLGPLPDRLIESLVRERCGEQSDATVQRVVARAAGNPLFARELAALLSAGADDSEVPGSALQLVRNRLARLPGTQRVLIPLVVLAGAQATWPVVSRAAAELGLDPGDHRTDASAWLGSDDLIGDCDGRLAARHPLVAEAALALLRRSDRARLHDVLAAVVEREAGERVADRHRIAAFEAAPTPVRAGLALPAACREAQLALRQGADEEAAGLARCALRAWSAGSPAERTQRLSDALDAHLTLGHALAITRPAEAEAAYEAGLRNAGCDDERARFGIARGWLAYVHGEYSRAAHCYQEARELPGLSPAVRAAVSVHQGWVFARVNLLERALELCEEAQAVINPEESPHTAALVNDRSGMILVWLGRLEEARVTLERAFEQVARVDDPGLLAGIQIHRADLASRCRDFETSLRLLDDALAVTRGAGDTYVEAVTWWIRTDVMVRMGDRSGAEAASREEERILRLLNNPSHLAACLRRRQGFAADSAGRTR